MLRPEPTADDYLKLFHVYGDDLGDIYKEQDGARYALLFEQVVRLLAKPSTFNLSLPEPFRVAARRYRDGHQPTVAQFSDPANRHFLLSELHDLIRLKASRRRKRHSAEA